MQTKKKSVRLSLSVRPTHYEIILKPDLLAFVFEGEETISLTLDRDLKKITLHSKDIEIVSAFARCGREKIFARAISYDEGNETASISFPSALKKGKIKLKLVFRGVLNDKMHGFYRSRYEVDGKTYHLATTQFEATDARRAFPCVDEPAAKAVFEVKLVVPHKSTALSNTIPTVIREHEAGYKVVEFAPTPVMSTYLLAFIVGDFEYVERKTKEGVLVRVFTTPGKKHQAEFALDCAVQTLSFFSKYFAIPYPMPVLDMIAIPDFAMGAMENWGAITYRESALLVDTDHSSAATRQWVALVVAHELSHQWFGNLVTMEWWTHLWLNEGFASYIEYLAVDHLFPSWNMWTQFVTSDLGTALTLDALKHTHPIEVEVHHPDDISEIFDSVSYAKGASVIRMLADYLGEEDFRDGLRFYLKKHSYKNTSTVHLWNAFEKVSKKPVTEIMKAWTKKSGHPILSVSREEDVLTIEQSRFFSSALSRANTKDKTLWTVPVSMRTATHSPVQKVTVDKKRVRVSIPSPSAWVKLNTGETGVFRTKYSPEILMALKDPVARKELGTIDRLGLLRDVFDLALAGDISTVDALEFVSAYKDETDFVVWTELFSGLGAIDALLHNEPCHSLFVDYACGLFLPMTKRVGWEKRENEGHTDTLLRSLILSGAGRYGDEKTILRAQSMWKKVHGRKDPIPADLRGVVYRIVAQYGGVDEFEKMIRMYNEATLHEEKNRIASALGYFQDEALLEKILEFSLSPDVRAQDTGHFISAVLVRSRGYRLGWEFLKKKWPLLLKRYGEQKDISSIISPLGYSANARIADAIEAFFQKNAAPGGERTLQQVLERIRAKSAWLMRDKKKIAAWLQTSREVV